MVREVNFSSLPSLLKVEGAQADMRAAVDFALLALRIFALCGSKRSRDRFGCDESQTQVIFFL